MQNNILNFAGIGYIKVSRNSSIIEINESAIKILGEKITKLAEELNPSFQYCIKNKSGHDEKIILGNKIIQLNLLYSDDDQNVDIILQDITRISDAEKTHNLLEKRLETIIDLIPDIIYRLNADGEITYINNAILNYGYTIDELMGKNIFEIIHPEDKDIGKYKLNERRADERNTKLFEIRILTKNGNTIDFEIKENKVKKSNFFSISASGLYISDESNKSKFIGTQGIARDITKRKFYNKLSNANKNNHLKVLDIIDDGYFEVDLKGNFILLNDVMAKIFGYEKDEMYGNNFKDYLSQKDGEAVNTFIIEVLKTNEPKIFKNKFLRNTDKIKKNIEGVIALNNDINNKPFGFIGIVRDVTSKSKMEQEILRARKLEAIAIFSGGIAHDYNNALTAIIGNISLAKMGLKDNLELLEILEDAEKASLKVKDLTEQLTTFSKGGKPVKKLITVKDMIYDIIQQEKKNFNGDFDISIADDTSQIHVDEFQISHAIQNIISNSKEAMTKKGIIYIKVENIDVEEEKSHHEITLHSGKYVKISIKDEGSGISDEIIENIFDPYFSTKEFASGMGLALTYAVIKRHRGYIDVKSKIKDGAIFSIYLPVPDEFLI